MFPESRLEGDLRIPLMAVNEALRFSLQPSLVTARCDGALGDFPAAALTQLIGIIRGRRLMPFVVPRQKAQRLALDRTVASRSLPSQSSPRPASALAKSHFVLGHRISSLTADFTT